MPYVSFWTLSFLLGQSGQFRKLHVNPIVKPSSICWAQGRAPAFCLVQGLLEIPSHCQLVGCPTLDITAIVAIFHARNNGCIAVIDNSPLSCGKTILYTRLQPLEPHHSLGWGGASPMLQGSWCYCASFKLSDKQQVAGEGKGGWDTATVTLGSRHKLHPPSMLCCSQLALSCRSRGCIWGRNQLQTSCPSVWGLICSLDTAPPKPPNKQTMN